MEAGSRSGIDKFLTHAQCTEAFKDRDFVVEAKLEIPGEVTKLVGHCVSATFSFVFSFVYIFS